MDVNFIAYFYEQIGRKTKEADFLGLGARLDVADFAEYQKIDKVAKINHYLAIQELRNMWKIMEEGDYRLEDLSAVAIKLNVHAKKAQDSYVKLLNKGVSLTQKADELEINSMPLARSSSQADKPEFKSLDDSASEELYCPPIDRSHVALSEGTSATNSSNAKMRRAQGSAQKARIAQLNRKSIIMKIMLAIAALGGLAIYSTNFVLVTRLIDQSIGQLETLHAESNTAIELRRVRQMQDAYAANDKQKFSELQNSLHDEMVAYTDAILYLYDNRDLNDPLSIDYYTQPHRKTIMITSLEIFQLIPKEVVKDILHQLEEADSDVIFSRAIVRSAEDADTKSHFSKSHAMFQLQQFVYAGILIFLTAMFAYLNVTSIITIGQNFNILDNFGDITTFTFRAVDVLNEIRHFDQAAWGSTHHVHDAFIQAAEDIADLFSHFLYGSPSEFPMPPSYNDLPDDIQEIILTPTCLPANQSLCGSPERHWNTSIGYTEQAVGSGLLFLSFSVMDIIQSYYVLAQRGPFIPDDPQLTYLNSVIEPDFLDGWTILGAFVQFWAVRKMISQFKFTEQTIYDILNRLPAEVKNVYEISNMLENAGVITKREKKNTNQTMPKKGDSNKITSSAASTSSSTNGINWFSISPITNLFKPSSSSKSKSDTHKKMNSNSKGTKGGGGKGVTIRSKEDLSGPNARPYPGMTSIKTRSYSDEGVNGDESMDEDEVEMSAEGGIDGNKIKGSTQMLASRKATGKKNDDGGDDDRPTEAVIDILGDVSDVEKSEGSGKDKTE
ncbi:hypothetical protein HDU76_012847 [Blyttiomyces sp. JEL0837]|nr:hypothetical protein HDU76_012847 [Blyttiomyces sp. JEL0837]